MSIMNPVTVHFGSYRISTDREQCRVAQVHEWLTTQSYWARNIPYETVAQSVRNSWCISILKEEEQVGFARIITDYATFGYLADVYIKEGHRGQGLSKEMMRVIMMQDWVIGLRRFLLFTQDAHGLYRSFGFSEIGKPENGMEIVQRDLYKKSPVQTDGD